MTELVPYNEAQNTLAGMSEDELLAAMAETLSTVRPGKQYIKFDGRDGFYSTGKEDAIVWKKQKVTFLMNTLGLQRGFACWKAKQPVDRAMKLYFLGKPLVVSELADHGPYSLDPKDREGWSLNFTMDLKDLDTGEQYEVTFSSSSATKAFEEFLLKQLAPLSAQYNPKNYTPVITMGSVSFTTKAGKNFKPTFVIDRWVKNDAGAVEQLEAPAKKKAK
jgi:hypothetical protein